MSTLTPSRSFERTADQRIQALQIANEVRSRRSALKRDLKAGRQSAVLLIADPPAWLQSMKVLDLLTAMPRVGRVKAARVLRATAVSPHKTVAGLSERQRGELVRALDVLIVAVGSDQPGAGGEGWR
jgi:hypothetical protein